MITKQNIKKSAVKNHKYPPDSAGRLMIDNVPTAHGKETISEVKRKLYRDIHKLETINYIYIVNSKNMLAGVISIKDILREPKEKKVSEIMNRELVFVHPHTDQERVAYKAMKNNIKSVPVLDKHKVFLGIVPSDTILSVMHNEANEDIMRLAGIHHKRGVTDNIMEMSIFTSIKHRLPWLLIGLGGGILTARIIGLFENTIQENLILAAFIPLISYMGGATEAQMVTFMIRDTAVNPRLKFSPYFFRHFLVTFFLGIFISAILYFIGFAFYQDFAIANVVGVALFATIISSVFTGLIVPHIFSRFKFDPANASGPIATIFQDLIGISLYFIIASMIL